MNAEALIGTVLGTCTLQKLIGQGGMGAVYLAQQSRPRRQVAVKVLLPIVPLKPDQQVAFLERFRRETDAAASLEHLNIMPVHEYGERDGLAYLVMPYVSGGTLRDEMERENQFPLSRAMNYLDQMAAALNVAHERGIIHRDIKPANILITPEKRLLLSDFGLVKIAAEGQTPQTRLTKIGSPMGTPDYMAPEQVMGGNVDARADLYSLGVILYQMVTGTTPFKADMPMQVAMQHLQIPPQPPRQLRPDLPASAEQVILRSLAKRPADRYMRAQDFASAFRAALTVANVPLGEGQGGTFTTNIATSNRLFTPRGLFDPSWQQGTVPPPMSDQTTTTPTQTRPGKSAAPHFPSAPAASAGMLSMLPPLPEQKQSARDGDIVAKTSMTLPSFTGLLPPSASPPSQFSPITSTATTKAREKNTAITTPGGPGISGNTPLPPLPPSQPLQPSPPPSRLRLGAKLRPMGSSGIVPSPVVPASEEPAMDSADIPDAPDASSALKTTLAGIPGSQLNPASPFPDSMSDMFPVPESQAGMTGVLPMLDGEYPGQGATMTMKLTQSVKIVKMPVAGQPGHYVTGFLPQLPPTPKIADPLPVDYSKLGSDYLKKNKKLALFAAVALVLLLGSSVFWIVRSHQTAPSTHKTLAPPTPNAAATATVQAKATAEENIIFSDSLSTNAHNWPESVNAVGPKTYVFTNGAYHISSNDSRNISLALLPSDEPLPLSFVYNLSLAEIHGDDTSSVNKFGMLLRFSTHQKNGKTSVTFYAFEVVNASNGEYQFWKYDNNYGAATDPWTKVWSTPFGHEYHFGHGSTHTNTFSVAMKGSKFVFIVNGKQVGKAQDTALSSGQIGMLVNLKGTEVAFSNLLLTYN